MHDQLNVDADENIDYDYIDSDRIDPMIWNAEFALSSFQLLAIVVAVAAADNSLNDYEQNLLDSEMVDGRRENRSCEHYMAVDEAADLVDNMDGVLVNMDLSDLSVAREHLYSGTDVVASYIENYTCTVHYGKVIAWKMTMIVLRMQHYNNFLQKKK